MKHKHNHCKHENLKYCEHCKVVHCLDCQQEFPEKETVVVEKVVYKERDRQYPYVTWEGNANLIRAVSDKVVYDKDRFVQTSDCILR